MNVVGFYVGDKGSTKERWLSECLNGFESLGYNIGKVLVKKGSRVQKFNSLIISVVMGWKPILRDVILKQNSEYISIFDPIVRPENFRRTLYDYRSICWNEHYGGYYYQDDLPDDRWKVLQEKYQIEVKPWREKGNHIVVIHHPSVPGYLHRDFMYDKIINMCVNTGRKIIICQRPNSIRSKFYRKWEKLGCKIKTWIGDNFLDSYCVINATGSSSIKSVFNGIPVYSFENSATDCLSNLFFLSDFLKNPPTPDRAKWFNWIAYQQWTLDEMSKGLFLNYIMHIRNFVSKIGLHKFYKDIK